MKCYTFLTNLFCSSIFLLSPQKEFVMEKELHFQYSVGWVSKSFSVNLCRVFQSISEIISDVRKSIYIKKTKVYIKRFVSQTFLVNLSRILRLKIFKRIVLVTQPINLLKCQTTVNFTWEHFNILYNLFNIYFYTKYF